MEIDLDVAWEVIVALEEAAPPNKRDFLIELAVRAGFAQRCGGEGCHGVALLSNKDSVECPQCGRIWDRYHGLQLRPPLRQVRK